MTDRYGNTRPAKIRAAYNDLRAAIRAGDIEAAERALDRYEPWADYVLGGQERIWPDAADGSPSLPMEPELWAAGCDLDTARFVARQLAKDGYALVRADETISMLKAERAKAYEAAAQVAEKHRAEYHGRAPLNPSAAMIDERMGAAASAIYSELSALAQEDE